jgi:hypothetical protein
MRLGRATVEKFKEASRQSASPDRILTVICTLTVAGIALFYFWSAGLIGAPWAGNQPEGHYNLQMLGFVRGHLHVALDPNPAMLALEDPYDPVANAAYRVHDMSLWKGRYYLYFGAAPTLLIFLPFHLITGMFLAEQAAVAGFCTVGLGMAAALLLHLRRRGFQRVERWQMFIMVAALGLGCPTLLLTQSPQFYQVPIACAYALSTAGVYCLARMLTSSNRGRAGWLLMTGLLFGLTQAARPNYVLAMPMLFFPVWWCIKRSRRGFFPRFKPFLFAFGPVAVVGVALLAYNWARFGSPLEFGMRYQLAGQSFINFTPLAWSNLVPHAADYLWQQMWWLPTFPFMDAIPEAPFGVLRYMSIVWIGALAFWPISSARKSENERRLVLAVVIAGLGLANLIMDSVFFFAPVIRYVSDFAPAFVLLGAIGSMTATQFRNVGSWARGVATICAVASIAVVLAVYVQRLPEAHRPVAVERFFNRLAAPLERWREQPYGRLRLIVELPREPAGAIEPLFQTGYSADRRDWLQIHYLSANRIQFGFVHAGLGELLGETIELPPDRRLVVDAACGSLLPQSDQRIFAGWSATEIASIRRKLEIKAGGATVLTAAIPCYPSRPGDLQLGILGFASDLNRPKFSGRILAAEKQPLVRDAVVPREVSIHRPVRLRLLLPAMGGGCEPLIAIGDASRGELFCLNYGPKNTVRLSLESLGRGGIVSHPIQFDPGRELTLDVWMGPCAEAEHREPAAGLESPLRRLYAKLGEKVIFNCEYAYQTKVGTSMGIGWNRIESSTAGTEFTGRVLDVHELDWDSLSAQPYTGQFGAVDLKVKFPVNAYGLAEPLVTTGNAGAGDALFVKYVGPSLVQFALDHWGYGVVASRPLPVDYSQAHRLEISMGSLYSKPEGRRGRLLLRLDGETVLDAETDFHPSAPQNIYVGTNMIGGSSCGPYFTGQIIELSRPAHLR